MSRTKEENTNIENLLSSLSEKTKEDLADKLNVYFYNKYVRLKYFKDTFKDLIKDVLEE